MADTVAGKGRGPRTAAEAGWHKSRYNLFARDEETGRVVVSNLFKGTVSALTSFELYLFSVLDELDEGHPIIGVLSRRGLICDFDERAASRQGDEFPVPRYPEGSG